MAAQRRPGGQVPPREDGIKPGGRDAAHHALPVVPNMGRDGGPPEPRGLEHVRPEDEAVPTEEGASDDVPASSQALRLEGAGGLLVGFEKSPPYFSSIATGG